ncbi:hypothetical protein [Flavobacterium sp.]|uniref:hypothetical protein n=1 Tax=Flavobacterium sp. TaxID=239 RepID=UPI00286B32DE|nr:hypothetical protein [Flavobacterium sp.]
MRKHILLILTISLISCKEQKKQSNLNAETKDPIEFIQENEKKSMEKQYVNLGDLIYTIEFNIKTENKKDYTDGFIPWASLENPKQDIPNLVEKEKIVIKQSLIKIIIDYPLTNQYEFTLTSNEGFSREQLLLEISNHYYKVFEEEENTATIKTTPIDKRTTMYNRNQTNGKYGIWGHDIADLVLSSINVYKTKNGEIILTLDIES